MGREGYRSGPPGRMRGRIGALLREAGRPLRTPEIIARLRTSKTNAHHHLTAMEADGLIRRHPGGGHRASLWSWLGE